MCVSKYSRSGGDLEGSQGIKTASNFVDGSFCEIRSHAQERTSKGCGTWCVAGVPPRLSASELSGMGFCDKGWKERTWPNEQSLPTTLPLCSFARIAHCRQRPCAKALFVRSQCVSESDRAGYNLAHTGRGFVRSHASLGGTKSMCEAQRQAGNSNGLHSAAAVQRLEQGKARRE